MHGQDVGGDPVGVQSIDGVWLQLVGEVVLLVAGLSAAKLAEEDGLFIEVVQLELSGLGVQELLLHDKSNRGC